MTDDASPHTFRYAHPTPDDGAGLYQLVACCPPLDLNSVYAYLLLGAHFSRTSIIARLEDDLVGMISGYRIPDRPDTLFVWQVAVNANARGRGLARRMLLELIARPALADVRFLETTVTPSNKASDRLFHSFAAALGAPCEVEPFFTSEQLTPPTAGGTHEAEQRYRIGPFVPQTTQEAH